MERYILWVRRLLPTPFTIALMLTIVSFLAVMMMNVSNTGSLNTEATVDWWLAGLWSQPLLVFAMQMMLMLVLGHVLALTPVASYAIDKLTHLANNTAQAAWMVCTCTMLVGLFNWGLGLIFGAILARKIGERFSQSARPLNYPLIGAAGYSALIIWHGGLSGSALIKASEPGSIHNMLSGILSDEALTSIPQEIPMEATAFSTGNILVCLSIILVVPLLLSVIGKIMPGSIVSIDTLQSKEDTIVEKPMWAEHLDYGRWFSKVIGMGLCAVVVYLVLGNETTFFTPNNINLSLLALCVLLHKNVIGFLASLDQAIKGASGILIQFPLYFGIMGLINGSGMVESLSDFFIAISDSFTYPLFTFLSAGIVNIFVPSGGGQWVIQGPIILKAAFDLGIPLEKGILALAYGDQITNMLQPFWALPLLGVTKLSARDILPYTLIMFIAGFLVYFIGLILI